MEKVDPEYAEQQQQEYHRRYLKITNQSNQTIYVWVKYLTKTSEGNWQWFPSDPDGSKWATYQFKPGESSYLNDDGFRVNANRVRIWAGNSQSASDWQSATFVWSQFEKRDLRLLPEEGEVGYYMRTYEHVFK